jgi:hypothetical protein
MAKLLSGSPNPNARQFLYLEYDPVMLGSLIFVSALNAIFIMANNPEG